MNTVISVKVDTEVKAAAHEVAKSAGLTLSALVNSYLRQIAATRRIELYAPEQMSPEIEGYIEKIEAEIERGEVSQKFDSIDAFLEDLKK